MKISEALKTKKAEESFGAALVVVVLLILPMWGGGAMLVGSVVGTALYAILFRERLRSRGWLKVLIPLVGAATLGAVLALTMSRGH